MHFVLMQFKRVGRGIGSSKGKTAGRGHKGQKARTGTAATLWLLGTRLTLVCQVWVQSVEMTTR